MLFIHNNTHIFVDQTTELRRWRILALLGAIIVVLSVLTADKEAWAQLETASEPTPAS